MKNVSLGARKLLKLFQWFWRTRGECYPKSFYLMARFEVCLRTIRRWIRELKAAGFLTVLLRGRRGAVYLEGVPVEVSVQQSFNFQNVTDSVTNTVTNSRVSSINEVVKLNPTIEAARTLIADFPGAKHLPGKPGGALARQSLVLAGGDLERLAGAMRAIYLAGLKPGYSWGWFPSVLAQYLGTRQRRA